MIDIESGYLIEIKNTLQDIVPNCDVLVYGSRVRGNALKYSDLDLAIVGREKLDWRIIEELKDAFAESDLPYRVDVLDWNAISTEFQKAIEKHHETIQRAKD